MRPIDKFRAYMEFGLANCQISIYKNNQYKHCVALYFATPNCYNKQKEYMIIKSRGRLYGFMRHITRDSNGNRRYLLDSKSIKTILGRVNRIAHNEYLYGFYEDEAMKKDIENWKVLYSI